jgi:hypothetical protein
VYYLRSRWGVPKVAKIRWHRGLSDTARWS